MLPESFDVNEVLKKVLPIIGYIILSIKSCLS